MPTYDGLLNDVVGNQVVTRHLSSEEQFPSDHYLRRNRSFDMADIYGASIQNEFNAQAFRHRRSVPDLSKVELVFEVDCTPIQPPPLVLNNPFYDGSYALNPAQLNQTMVVLPDNYLAFEDSFVPWNYKPELVVEAEINPELYFDGLPLIPSNDPWSAYGNENAAFEYYSPQFMTPVGEQDGIHYMPLADFEYAIPQYMSLPTIEQVNVETFIDNTSHPEETATVSEIGRQNEHPSLSQPEIVTSSIPSAISSNTVSEDEKVCAIDSSTKESSIQSEESLNADISNDVTSSLAFIPCSKSSQIPHDADDTSDDTSPCSTDYQEASALDIVQSLDDLSCCDSIDFSQSKDEVSPVFSDPFMSDVVLKSEIGHNLTDSDRPQVLAAKKALANIPLSKLPSIPIQDKVPTKLPPDSNNLIKNEIGYITGTSPNVQQILPSKSEVVNSSEFVVTQNEASHTKLASDVPSETQVSDNTVALTKSDVLRITLPPQPPAVPPAWLASRTQNCEQTTSFEPAAPQICVENPEGQPVEFEKSPKPPGRTNQPVEPVPSCSFVPPQLPSHASQLKPKEVEVSFSRLTVFGKYYVLLE